MKGENSERTASFSDNLWGFPLGHIYLSVEESRAENEVGSGGPRHRENQAQAR